MATDFGLLPAARTLPWSALLASRFTATDRLRHRRILTSAARGERHQPDKPAGTLSDTTQGLGGAAVFCGLPAALFGWRESLSWYPVFVALGAVSGGALALLATLAAMIVWGRFVA